MCTSIILFRKEHHWPVIIGSNRDENLSRKSSFPEKHWKIHHPTITGGFDSEKGGSWIAVNDSGLVAIIHNRKLDVKNNFKKISRGKIILDILNYDNIQESLESLQNLKTKYYEGFNILLCDKSNCYLGKHSSVEKEININEIREGISILTDNDLNNINNKKINYYLNKFSNAPVPDPDKNDWLSWELLLSTEKIENQNSPEDAICFIDKLNNFGTKSSSLIAISSIKKYNKIIFKSTKSSPSKSEYLDVELN